MTETTVLESNDRDARQAALDIGRSFIVQAPAGSGKTELLIQRYLRLLASVAEPEEVLAITFTRKAAAEMQVRVLDALSAADRGDAISAEYQRTTRRAADAVLAADQRSGWGLLSNPRRLRIQTMDALNASIARNQPLTSSGGPTGVAVVADSRMRKLYQQAALRTLDQLVGDADLRATTALVLAHLDNNTGLYLAYLARMLATRDQWLPFVGSGSEVDDEAVRESLEANLGAVMADRLGAVAGRLPREHAPELVAMADHASRHLPDSLALEHPLRALSPQLPAATAESLAAWKALAELLLTTGGEWRRRLTVNNGFPPADKAAKARMLDLIATLSDVAGLRDALHTVRVLPDAGYSDAQWTVLKALFHLLPLAVTELKFLFNQHSVCDHIEVALDAAAALGSAESPGEAALLLDYRIRHLLVDEMQDTSFGQYRMLEALTAGWEAGDGRTLFCVGDPMQSIYRFRNAEVGQFLVARQQGIGLLPLEPLTLRRNFRSGDGLVDWFNRVFPEVLAPADDPQQSAVAYEAAISVEALHGFGNCEVHPVIGADPEVEAAISLALIEHTLAECPEDDVAVLVRGRTHLPQLLARLQAAGIDYSAVEIDRLTDLPEIIDALALVRVFVHEGDRIAWLAVLRAPWTGLSLADLHALVVGDRSSPVSQLLDDPERLASLSPDGQQAVARFKAVLAEFRAPNRTRTLRQRVEAAWLRLGGAAVLSDQQQINNVYRLFDVIERIEVAGTLADVGELETLLDSEHVSSEQPARLQIMTIHRAKGLQFEHVILHGLGRVPRAPESKVLNWFDFPTDDGQTLKVISPVGQRADVERDPLYRFIAETDRVKDRHEMARLLYVACTRARRSLHLVGHANLRKSGIGADPRSLLALLWPAAREQFEAAAESVDETERSEVDPLIEPRRRWLPDGWQPPAIAPLVTATTEATATPHAVEFYWVGSEARVAGTLAHRWLQRIADDALTSVEPELFEATTQRWLQQLGIGGAGASDILERVRAAVAGTLADEKGRWLVSGEGSSELALTGVVEGELRSLVLDRVRVDADGTHWIVDYKTSTHEGGGLDRFLDAEVVRYEAQLSQYAEVYRAFSGAPVRSALYFPLLQAFVEVPV